MSSSRRYDWFDMKPILFNARPHPGPLPQGEGESFPAALENPRLDLPDVLTNNLNRSLAVPSLGGEGQGEGGRQYILVGIIQTPVKTLFSEIRSAVMATFVLALVCCGIYPLVVYGIAQVEFPHQANGSLIVEIDGTVRGSKLLGQGFTAAKYFHPRPSAAGNGYDAANSSGSNLGPTSQKLHDAIKDRIAGYRAENGLSETVAVPADAVTASGSGLDPHITVRNAELQAPRVAKTRHLSEAKVHEFIKQDTDLADLGFLGEPGVNVLKLNLSLDQLQ
jgi:K+-transporting ATPase ATPase C chain